MEGRAPGTPCRDPRGVIEQSYVSDTFQTTFYSLTYLLSRPYPQVETLQINSQTMDRIFYFLTDGSFPRHKQYRPRQ